MGQVHLISVYIDMGRDDVHRQVNYKRWIMDSVPQGKWANIRKVISKGNVFDNIYFKEKLEKILGRKLYVRERGRPRNK